MTSHALRDSSTAARVHVNYRRQYAAEDVLDEILLKAPEACKLRRNVRRGFRDFTVHHLHSVCW
jgi:hypothetical protein